MLQSQSSELMEQNNIRQIQMLNHDLEGHLPTDMSSVDYVSHSTPPALQPPLPSNPSNQQRPLMSRLRTQSCQFFCIILPLSLVMGIITADMSNLEFVHLVEIKAAVPMSDSTMPADHILNFNKLRWTFLQSAYLLPIMLLAGPVLILQFVLLVGRLRPSRLVDGLNLTLEATALIVGLMTLLNAYVGTYVVGVIFTRMLTALAVCSALGLIALAVELLPPRPDVALPNISSLAAPFKQYPAAVGFSTVMFGTIYGLGTAFASCSTMAGYQLATLFQRNGITFRGTGSGDSQGFRTVFLVEGFFILALCPVIYILLTFAGRSRARKQHLNFPLDHLHTASRSPLPTDLVRDTSTSSIKSDTLDTSRLPVDVTSSTLDGPINSKDGAPNVSKNPDHTPTATHAAQADDSATSEEEEDDKKTALSFAALRRFSSYCTSPLAHIAILNRNNGGGTSSVAANIRTLHSGFGLWLSTLLQKIMVFVYGRLGVDEAAFELISAGTSSRETFICGVLIVSNTVIIQLAVISLIEPLKAATPQQYSDPQQTDTYLGPDFKFVPTLPGLPTLAGGVSGCISSILWSVLAVQGRPQEGQKGRFRGWTDRPWWVPSLLAACLIITLAGLGLAVVADAMVPTGEIRTWSIYAATVVTYFGSTPQLPLALLQIYTVLDAELGRNVSSRAISIRPLVEGANQGNERDNAQPTGRARIALTSTSATVHAVRWERVGVLISTLTTIAGSELLTAWVFLLPEGAQMAFLFTSAVLAIGGSVWLLFRHTWPLRRRSTRNAGLQ